ncbi:predicted protein [Lichtheimia corymbifera JMRC:FSU:9682]|uniref:Membrane anchor Opy2 N-terminal domain-containing protein n=1 Tax=Lichtheimia corymbifera JMRC:FSU:9682 TaxID=1263082 RepID=A0A068S0B0_9FUNG|nr:predicted protein [Lichtheimia corymbifera JMRC:FSU:9682]
MHLQKNNSLNTLLLTLVTLAAVAMAVVAIEPTSVPLNGPSGTVCAAVVCPSSDGNSAAPCPERCKDACVQVQDPCCPDQTVAVCSDEYSSVVGGGGSSTTAVASSSGSPSSSTIEPSASATTTSTTAGPSGSEVPSENPSSSSSPPAESSTEPNNEGGAVALAGRPGVLLPLALLVIAMLMG